MNRLVHLCFFAFYASIGFVFQNPDPAQALSIYTNSFTQEKIYIHTDKPFYAAGETIWIKAYLRNASNHTINTSSKIIYTDLINPAGEVFVVNRGGL